MNRTMNRVLTRLVCAALALSLAVAAQADSAEEIEAKVERARTELLAAAAAAPALEARAAGVLYMPDIVKAGLIIGGAYGEGALKVGGETVGYYSMAAATFGLQIGAQTLRQAIFFMTEEALSAFRRADGWTAGAELSGALPGMGASAELDSVAAGEPVVLVTYGQDGLMLGAALDGAKYSQVNR